MEKNVPLLKLIQDPWSIKTMLSSRFMCVPLRPTTIHPSCRNHKPTPKQTQHKEVGGACGKGAGARKTKKNRFCFVFLISVVDVLLLRFHSHSCKRCWCSESEGTSLQTPGLDRQVPKVTTTGEEPILPLRLSRPRFSFFVSKNSFAALQSESVCLLFP